MESPKKMKRIRILIITLSVLLAISLTALAVTLINSAVSQDKAAGSNTGNIITSQSEEAGEAANPAEDKTDSAEGENGTEGSAADKTDDSAPEEAEADAPSSGDTQQGGSNDGKKKKTTIELNSRQAEDNSPFEVMNMFPGDEETKDYSVKVSHYADVTVHFRADIRKGYAKLAEVLKVRVELLTTNEMLYDGLMKDMPKSLTHELKADGSTTSVLDYKITAYLDTSVGNEYQNKTLKADFRWWVEGDDAGELDPPKTGDDSLMLIWILIAAAALTAIIILLLVIRKKDRENE